MRPNKYIVEWSEPPNPQAAVRITGLPTGTGWALVRNTLHHHPCEWAKLVIGLSIPTGKGTRSTLYVYEVYLTMTPDNEEQIWARALPISAEA